MANKIYAVRKGLQTGIFDSWDACKNAVTGYSNAEYQSFKTIEEANAYMNNNLEPSKTNIIKPCKEGSCNIYYSSSFSNSEYNIGIVIESVDREYKFYGKIGKSIYTSLGSITGELLAVLIGVELAHDMGFTQAGIYYKYGGVYDWYTGNWRAKGDLQVKYTSLLRNMEVYNCMVLNFTHISKKSYVDGVNKAEKLVKLSKNRSNYIDLEKILQGRLSVSDISLCTTF